MGESTQEIAARNGPGVFYSWTPGGKHPLHLVKHLLADYGTDGDIRLSAFTLIRMTAFIDSGRFAGRGWPRGTRGSRPAHARRRRTVYRWDAIRSKAEKLVIKGTGT